MAIYHLSAHAISAGSGKSAVHAAAYRRATEMVRAATGLSVDYSQKDHVVHAELALPASTPAWFRTGIDGRSEDGASNFLWNAIETKEGTKGWLAMEMNIALPAEMSRAQNIALVQDWVAEHVTAKGFVADWAFHDSPGNPHFHVMIPLRKLTESGFGPKFDYARDRDGNLLFRADGKHRYEKLPAPMKELMNWRRAWAVSANRHLAMAGLELRIDHRSHKETGIVVEPTTHIGVTASSMAARGKDPDRVREEAQKRARNAKALVDDPSAILPILTREKSVFDERDIAKALFRYIDDPATFEAVRLRVGLSPELVAIAEEVIDPETERVIAPARWTTRSLLQAEVTMQITAGELYSDRSHALPVTLVEAALAERGSLSEQQAAAVRHVTSPERITAVVGFAGAGKSTMLGVARDAWKRGGYRVHGAALAGKAADGLQRSAGIPSRTLASWELGWNKGRDLLNRGDVFVLDEAGMVSSQQLSRIVQEVERCGAKLVLVGDAAQLQPIEAGAAFRAITETIGAAELSEIWRQADPQMRAASVAFARGKVAEGLEVYQAKDSVRFTPSHEAARAAVIAAWKPDYLSTKPDGRRTETLILAHTNADTFALNAMAREALKAEGGLLDEARFVTARGERMFAPGDRVIFLENDSRLAVKNGMLATVEAAQSGGVTVRLDRDGFGDGDTVTVHAAEYRNLDHGYAATVHKNQGATVDRVHVLATPGMDRHLTYVAMSRHRDSAVLHGAHEDFIGPRTREALEAKLGTGPTPADYDAAALSGLVRRLSRDGSKTTTLDFLAQKAFREAVVGLANPPEAGSGPASEREAIRLDPSSASASLDALAARLERVQPRASEGAARVRPADLRALAAAFAERRGLRNHAALLPALTDWLNELVREIQQGRQKLERVGARLGQVFAGIQARAGQIAPRVLHDGPLDRAIEPTVSVLEPSLASSSAPAADIAPPAPLPPFLPAVDLGTNRLDQAAMVRIADDPELARERENLLEELALKVHDPEALRGAILAELHQPRAVFETRVKALLASPDSYGGLRGKSGLLAGKAAKAERAKAEQADLYCTNSAHRLKSDLDGKLDQARAQELAYRARLRIEIPGLSPEASTALRAIGAAGSGERNAAMRRELHPHLRQEIEAFAKIVGRRFGENGTIGFRMEQSLPPGHGPVAPETIDLINGAGTVAIHLKNDTLERTLSKTLVRQPSRDRGLSL